MNVVSNIENMSRTSDAILFRTEVLPQANRTVIYLSLFFYSAVLVQNIREIVSSPVFEFQTSQLLILGVALLPYLYLLTRPGLFRAPEAVKIVVSEESVAIPKKLNSKPPVAIPYKDILGIDVRGAGNSQFLVIETKRFNIQLPVYTFVVPEDLQKLADSITQQRLSKLPDQVDSFAERKARSDQYLRIVPIGTIVLCIALIAGFFLQQIATNGALYRLPGVGANSSLFLAEGEWFRLLSSSFLHSGIIHLLLNLAGLAALGYVIEGMLGTGRFIAIYTASLFIGSLVSAAQGSLLSVGASAPLFGLLGAYAYLHVFSKKQIPIGFIMRFRWWLGILLLNMGLPVLLPRIDIAAHVGGFVAGVIVTLFFMLRNFIPYLRLPSLRAPTVVSNFSAALCLLAFGIALNEAKQQYTDTNKRTEINLRVMTAMISLPGISPQELNSFAWEIAIDKKASKKMIELAHDAARHAVERQAQPNIADTYATILYRMGLFESAIRIETQLTIEATTNGDRTIYSSQLARFLTARSLHTGHTDAELLKKAHQATGHQLLEILRTESSANSILIRGEKNSHPFIIIFSKETLGDISALAGMLEEFNSLRLIGTFDSRLQTSGILFAEFAEEVNSYALYNSEDFSPRFDLNPYRLRVIEGTQFLV